MCGLPAHLGKLAKHERDRFPHTLIRIHPDLVTVDPHVADRHRQEQLAALRLTTQRFDGAQTQGRQLHLAHCQPVPERSRTPTATLLLNHGPPAVCSRLSHVFSTYYVVSHLAVEPVSASCHGPWNVQW